MFFKKKKTKVFEDYFSELQADMVDICLEYVENYADMIYIYCSCEPKMLSADVFYRINNMCLRKHKINDAPGEHPEYFTTIDNQKAVIQVLIEDLKSIQELCKKHNRPMPTEMKLYYNVKTGGFDADYKYEAVCADDSGKLPDDIFDAWFSEESVK
ncbi:hypothetical protein [Butyrivibrio proteoclasticus]|uniref:hypothetical protein n=1 Tax=Butyrivibrio proteoclasticus TaxID=43305 RepID=UPI00047B9F68|nr:hypothetical protein [Butyrivibrio proteoclasticus]